MTSVRTINGGIVWLCVGGFVCFFGCCIYLFIIYLFIYFLFFIFYFFLGGGCWGGGGSVCGIPLNG